MRNFDSGATRNTDTEELDYEAFIDPRVLQIFAEYMHKNRFQADGKIRDGDNWKKGIPLESYMKSLYRHTHDVWMEHRGYESRDGIKEGLCGVLFNAMGMLYELDKKEKDEV